MVMMFKYTYYVEAFFDFIVSLGLYLALWQMLRAMSRVQYLQNNFEGKSMAKNFVSAFGISFLTTSFLNFVKSFWWEQYLEVVQNRPYIFSTFCFLFDLFNQVLPISLMLVMHRKNFTENNNVVENEPTAQIDEIVGSGATL